MAAASCTLAKAAAFSSGLFSQTAAKLDSLAVSGGLRPASCPGNAFDSLRRSFGSSRVTAMAGTGKFFVGGNWKCNGTTESIAKLVSDLNAESLEDNVDVIVSPPFVYLPQVIGAASKRIEVAGQNCWVGKGGAFTGEISAEMLVDLGAKWVILGHSERRHILKESNEFIGQKQEYALSKGLKVIACVGELLEERESGHTFDVVFEQLKATADHVSAWDDVVIAYEPVWAIGTGKVASPQQAQEVHAAIRTWLQTNVSSDVASKTRIIYGGSVTAANSAELAKEEDIDGFLVGGASLKGPDFAAICNSVTSKAAAVKSA
ncbi:unnamed protein product [Closterium sp. NIES-65]|nr:unnamed protein product [Closterium sp. NIES-65]